MRSLFTGIGLDLFDFPFSDPISGPKIFSAILTSSTVTGHYLIMFCLSIALKFSTVGHPIM
jgi:hypothetical protein